ncbi:MAG: glycoside hydrolase, partial [Nitrosomonas sp.]|nr:glycoside hydrolase [Nitrosomonas sp.]
MIISQKVFEIRNVVVTVVSQALQILRNNNSNRAASFIQKIRIFRNLYLSGKFSTQFVALALIIFVSPLLGGAKHAFGSSFPIVTNSVKWHPGHYYTILNYGKNSSRYLSQIYEELKRTPALRGIQVNYRWAELEQAEDEYDFSSIAQRLSELSSMKKRLVILIDTKTSLDSDEEIAPKYLKTQKYAGGEFKIGYPDRNGRNIKLWNSAVRDRLSALIAALGKRFNSDAYFEGIGLSDTSISKAYIPLTQIQREDYYANLLHVQQQMRNHFLNTLTFQSTSYPRLMLKT